MTLKGLYARINVGVFNDDDDDDNAAISAGNRFFEQHGVNVTDTVHRAEDPNGKRTDEHIKYCLAF